MKATFKAKFTKAQVQAYVNKQVAAYEKAIESRLKKIGENFVTNARNNGNYKDQTGNLRSSIYYRLYKNGQLIDGGGESGTSEGEKAANKLFESLEASIVSRYAKGFVLVVVAGMDYAAAVEAKGKDVITGSSKIAINELKTALAKFSNSNL